VTKRLQLAPSFWEREKKGAGNEQGAEIEFLTTDGKISTPFLISQNHFK